VVSERLGKFSTLLDYLTPYKNADSFHHDPICRVLNMELLQFYYSPSVQSEALKGHSRFPPTGLVWFMTALGVQYVDAVMRGVQGTSKKATVMGFGLLRMRMGVASQPRGARTQPEQYTTKE
jgi:hypothetical protein